MPEAVAGHRKYTITLLKDRYPSLFNSPRLSRHKLSRNIFVPFNKIQREWDGMTVVAPSWRSDLLHVVNRIPITSRRFICSHESGVPRCYGLPEKSRITRFLQSRLRSKHCRRIIGMSHFAARCMRAHQERLGFGDELDAKSMVQHPNIRMGPAHDRMAGDTAEQLILTFVGGHFARKGGCVAVRLAELARIRNLPIHVNIVSSMQMGAHVWTDPTGDGFFDPVLRAMSSPNITHYEGLPNDALRELLGHSHFTLLPTFADTFGFSVIEGMAEHTPAITTDICALPEFMKDEYNGLVVPLEKDALGEWVRPRYHLRHTDAYATHFADEVERLSLEIMDRLDPLIANPSAIHTLRKNARLTAEIMFSTEKISPLWDRLYEDVIHEDLNVPPGEGRNISSPSSVDAALLMANHQPV